MAPKHNISYVIIFIQGSKLTVVTKYYINCKEGVLLALATLQLEVSSFRAVPSLSAGYISNRTTYGAYEYDNELRIEFHIGWSICRQL